MKRSTYRIILKGISEERPSEEVKENLAALFKSTPERIDGLIKTGPVLLKKGVGREMALKYAKALKKAGAIFVIEKEPLGESGLNAKPQVENGSGEEDRMMCPRCGFEQPDSSTCVRCGIIVDRYLEKKAKDGSVRGTAIKPGRISPDSEGRKHIIEKLLGGHLKTFQRIFGPTGTIIVGCLILSLAALFLSEQFFLRGKLVAHGYVEINDRNDHLLIRVRQPGVKHLVDFYTRRKSNLSVRLTDPEGEEIYNRTELRSHKGGRSFHFTPMRKGNYRLYINRGATSFVQSGSAQVRVYENDRRIITPLLGRLNI